MWSILKPWVMKYFPWVMKYFPLNVFVMTCFPLVFLFHTVWGCNCCPSMPLADISRWLRDRFQGNTVPTSVYLLNDALKFCRCSQGRVCLFAFCLVKEPVTLVVINYIPTVRELKAANLLRRKCKTDTARSIGLSTAVTACISSWESLWITLRGYSLSTRVCVQTCDFGCHVPWPRSVKSQTSAHVGLFVAQVISKQHNLICFL